MRRPLRSSRPTISPTRPRSTASGLQRTRVRVLIGGHGTGPLSDPIVTSQARRGRADDVERAGDDDLPVGAVSRRSRGRTASATSSTTSTRSRSTPSSTAASATACGIERRAGSAGGSTTSARRVRRVERLEHLVRLLLAQQPDDERARRESANSSASAARERCAPATLWAPSSTRAAGARRPRAVPATRTVRERLGDELVVERAPRNASRRGERERGVVGLVRAVERQEHVGVARAPACTGRRTRPPMREPVGAHAEVDVAAQDARRGRARGRTARARGRSRRARASTPGFTIPAFSAAISSASGRGTRRGRRSRW